MVKFILINDHLISVAHIVSVSPLDFHGNYTIHLTDKRSVITKTDVITLLQDIANER